MIKPRYSFSTPTLGGGGTEAQQLADFVGLDILQEEVDDGWGVRVHEVLALRHDGDGEQGARLVQGELQDRLTRVSHTHTHNTTSL